MGGRGGDDRYARDVEYIKGFLNKEWESKYPNIEIVGKRPSRNDNFSWFTGQNNARSVL